MEVETQIMIAERLCYVSPETAEQVLGSAAELGKVHNGLMNSLQ